MNINNEIEEYEYDFLIKSITLLKNTIMKIMSDIYDDENVYSVTLDSFQKDIYLNIIFKNEKGFKTGIELSLDFILHHSTKEKGLYIGIVTEDEIEEEDTDEYEISIKTNNIEEYLSLISAFERINNFYGADNIYDKILKEKPMKYAD